ncbi:carboxymuconolactone decarboxylase family protein [Salsipaludibacter albus]|uniref:carboxymuconolactone decarboxylase family protein n=1 Tax=Salsipaludibacter albus TaxID=2849650 RepID=UPI0023688A5F|nr:carboxymuconolactone decarboxylase family protein [Salsipaludibacter albus]MBY5163659.1 carboxymuconolactone decarboxylase family protein [Salsipaludibacter albus]
MTADTPPDSSEAPPDPSGDPPGPAGFPLADHDDAMAVRRAVLGDDHVDAAVAATTTLNAPFQELATRVAWGGLWSRDGLPRDQRSLVTIGILAALGREAELRMHLRSALERTGVRPEQLVEVLLHTAIYAGLPAANEGFRILAEVVADTDTRDGSSS